MSVILQLIGKHDTFIGRQTVVNLNLYIGGNAHQHLKLQFGKRNGISGGNDTRLHATHLHLGGDFIEFAYRPLLIFGIDNIIVLFRQFIAFLQNFV